MSYSYDLAGEIAIVTGGTKNIGRAASLGLAACGATVACCYAEDDASAKETVAEVERAGGTAQAYRVDLADPDDIARTVEEARASLGTPTILVNNAARRPRQKIADITPADFDAVFAVNQRAPFLLAQALLPGMRDKHWGRIVNVSGIDAYTGSLQRPHVTSTKLGIVGLSRALALEAAPWGVTVNVVVPGSINTVRDHPEWYPERDVAVQGHLERIPLGRQGRPEEVAAAIVFLCSREGSYFTGQELMASGGYWPLTRSPWYEY